MSKSTISSPAKVIFIAVLLITSACTSTTKINTDSMSTSEIELEIARANHNIHSLTAETQNGSHKSNKWFLEEIERLKNNITQYEYALNNQSTKASADIPKINTEVIVTSTKAIKAPKISTQQEIVVNNALLTPKTNKVSRFPKKDFPKAKEVPLASVNQLVSAFKQSINRPSATLIKASVSDDFVYFHYQENSYKGFTLIKGFNKKQQQFTEGIIIPID